MKHKLLLTLALSIGTAVFSTPSLQANPPGDWEFYWPTPNSHHVQPLFTSKSSCNAVQSSATPCVDFGNICNWQFYSSQRVYDNSARFRNQGYVLEIKKRATGKTVCRYAS